MADAASVADPEESRRNFRLEAAKALAAAVKWIAIAAGSVVSFWIIDVGKLNLERQRSANENQRQILDAYLKATETAEPELWKRKLRVLQTFSDDDGRRKWAEDELAWINEYFEKATLYRETLKVASRLAVPGKDDERNRARVRFEQLYFADLPFVNEERPVGSAMAELRKALVIAESGSSDKEDANAWNVVDLETMKLAEALKENMPAYVKPPPAPKTLLRWEEVPEFMKALR